MDRIDVPEITFAFRINLISNFFVGPIYARLEKESQIIRPEVVTLFCLGEADGLSAQEICELTGRPKNSISRGVRRLEQRGWIHREQDTEDRRRARLWTTEDGRAALAALKPRFIAREHAMLACLTATERRQLDKILDKLAGSVADWAS